MSVEKDFLAHLATIEAIIRCICRRHRMSVEEGQDFGSEVKLRLIDNNYHILRAWEGREGASIETFLTTVIMRMRLDFVRQLTGKYRSSEAAKALGPYAVELEILLVRDGRAFQDAFEQLKPRFPEVSEKEAEAIVAQLPPRTKRHKVGEEVVADLPDPGGNPETQAIESERAARKKRVLAMLDEARGRLSEDDRLIVKLLIYDGWKIVKIARHLNRDAKPLYRRIQRIWDELRDILERNGFRREDLRDALEHDGPEELDDDEEPRNRQRGSVN